MTLNNDTLVSYQRVICAMTPQADRMANALSRLSQDDGKNFDCPNIVGCRKPGNRDSVPSSGTLRQPPKTGPMRCATQAGGR
jgi:hypothetical protein